MDYHSLPRRQLQTLCKTHGIPANTTNVAMANCLSALLNRKPELEAGADMGIDAAEATPRPALRKGDNGDHEASFGLERVNCPYLDTPSNSAELKQEDASDETENNDLGDRSMPRKCMIDPSITQSRLKKGSVSFSETVEVKVMQSYEDPAVDMPSLSNVKKTRTSTRLSVGGTPTAAATPVGRRSSALKSSISESDTVVQKVASVTRSSARKGSVCSSSEEIKAENSDKTSTSNSVSRRRNANISSVSNASTKVEVEDTVGRSRPPRTPRAASALKKNNGLDSVLSELSAVDDNNVFITPAVTSVKKSNRSTLGTLEKKHLDSAFERVDKSENESSTASADISETPEPNCRVTRGSIGRITRSASKSLISGQTANRIESIPITRRNTRKERVPSDTPDARDGTGCSMRNTVGRTPCLSKDFEGLTLSDDVQPSSESSNTSVSVVKVTDPNDGQIESNVVAENIFTMDACVENLSQALPSESTIKEHSEDVPSLHSLENSSANSNAPISVDSSIEECQDESSSKEDLLDTDDVGSLENTESANVDEFIRGTLLSLVENTVLNSNHQKKADGYHGTEENGIQLTLPKSDSPIYSQSCNSEFQYVQSDCDKDVQSKMLNEAKAKEDKEELGGPHVDTKGKCLSEAHSEDICFGDVILFSKTQTSSSSDVKIVASSAESNGLVISNENVTLENVDVGGSDTVLDLPIFCNDICPTKSPKTNSLNECEDQDTKFCLEEINEGMESLETCDGVDASLSVIEYNDNMDCLKHCSRIGDEETMKDTEALDETQSGEHVSTEMEHLKVPEHLEETLCAVDLNEDIKTLSEPAFIGLTCDVSKESIEEYDAEVEACITVEGSEDLESESVNLIQNAIEDYTFSLQQNSSLQLTNVEESLVSNNAAAESEMCTMEDGMPENDIDVIVQKFADLSTSVDEVVEISSGIDQTDVSLVEEVDWIVSDVIVGELVEGHHSMIAETNVSSENETKSIGEPSNMHMEVGRKDDAQLPEAVNVCAIQLSEEAQPIPSNDTIVQTELMHSPMKVDWMESTTDEVNTFSEKEGMAIVEPLVVGMKIGSDDEAQLVEAANEHVIQSCEEAKLIPSSTMITEIELKQSPKKDQLSSMSLRKLKVLVKKKDKTKSKVSKSAVVVETTEVLPTDIEKPSEKPTQIKATDKEKPSEKSLSVTPLSGVKKPWKLSSNLMNNSTLSPSNDSTSSAGKRSALKSLPSNVRQASSGGGTPTGKLGSLAHGVGKVQSPALDHSHTGTENRLVMTPSRLALNSCQKINHSVRSLHR